MDKTAIVKTLVSNCSCWKGKEATLNEKSRAELKKLLAATELPPAELTKNARAASVSTEHGGSHKLAAMVHNAAAAKSEGDLKEAHKEAAAWHGKIAENKFGDDDDEDDDDEDDDDEDDDEDDDDDDEDEPRKKGKGKMKNNVQLSAADRETLDEAHRIVGNERKKLVKRLTANVANDDARKTLTTKFMTKPLAELRELALLVPNQRPETVLPSFEGAGGFHDDVTTNDAADDLLDLPTINWAEK